MKLEFCGLAVWRFTISFFWHRFWFSKHLSSVIYATAKVSIDFPGVHDASTRFEESKYLVLGDRSKLKNPVDETKHRIQDGSNLLTTQVNATSYGRAIEQPVDLAVRYILCYIDA
ncbi:hypothetical protein QUA20_21180 [Microcoleus sp. Pol7_A1]|uniref:hypothetical protein n=1 Tax=Microcoleus sp. Pol7_A1 TaxID=2818893 RepID=UPI002FD31550